MADEKNCKMIRRAIEIHTFRKAIVGEDFQITSSLGFDSSIKKTMGVIRQRMTENLQPVKRFTTWRSIQ